MLKRIIIGALVMATLVFLLAQTAYANGTTSEGTSSGAETEDEDSNVPTTDTSSMESFSVKTYLTVPAEDGDTSSAQGQGYLDDTANNGSPVMNFIMMIINTLLMVIGTACMVLIIIGGVLMMSSEGDDNRVQKGKTILTQAIIGLVLAFSSYVLVTFVQSLLYVSGE